MTDREIKHSGIQNVSYIEREDGELILTNYDLSRQAYIFGQENMAPEEYERVVRKIQEARMQAERDTHRKRDNVEKPSE